LSQRVGWTENDHRLFMQWFHADPAVYGADALRRLLDAAPDAGVTARLAAGVDRLARVASNPALWAMLLALPWVLLRHGVLARRALALAAALLCAALLATLLLAAFLKSAPQVYLSLCAFVLSHALALPAPPGATARRGTVETAAAVLALGGVLLS